MSCLRRLFVALIIGHLLAALFLVLGYFAYREYYSNDRLLDRFRPSNCNITADQLTTIPGFNESLPYSQYSGYLDSLDNQQLFYWFFESETRNPDDPLAVWLNGGPGCSSLFGLFSELGPIRLNMNGSLSRHHQAWNKQAHLLFLESPAGTGFSYRPNTLKYQTNDEDTAKANFAALLSFFCKFPHLVNNSFYITGESYAGRYIPELAIEIIRRRFPINFKGVAIGNGYLDPNLEKSLYRPYLEYNNLTQFTRSVSHTDPRINNTIYKYNIRKQCTPTYPSQIGYVNRSVIERMYFESGSDIPSPDDLPPCGNEIPLTEYLNRADVQEAIHVVKDSGIGNWTICSLLKSNYMYYDEKDSDDRMRSMADEVRYLVEAGIKVVIYSGDMDVVCNWMAAQKFVHDLGFTNLTTAEPWIWKNISVGAFNRYEKNLTFVRIFDAGHMVPIDKPDIALEMFNSIVLMDF